MVLHVCPLFLLPPPFQLKLYLSFKTLPQVPSPTPTCPWICQLAYAFTFHQVCLQKILPVFPTAASKTSLSWWWNSWHSSLLYFITWCIFIWSIILAGKCQHTFLKIKHSFIHSFNKNVFSTFTKAGVWAGSHMDKNDMVFASKNLSGARARGTNEAAI